MSTSIRLDKYAQLREAIKKGNKDLAKELLLNIAVVNLDLKFPFNTLLHWAILKSTDTEIIEILLEKKANIHTKNHKGRTSLDLAVKLNKVDVVKLLLAHDAHVSEDLESLMHRAIANSNTNIVELLVDYSVQNNLLINIKNSLDLAIELGNTQLVKYLLPLCKFETLNDKHIPKDMVLNDRQSYRDCSDYLLQNGYTLSPSSEKDDYFIYCVVENGYSAIVRELLKLGIDVNMRNERTGLTLLHAACLNKQSEIAEILIQNQADVNIKITRRKLSCKDVRPLGNLKNLVGKTALYLAVKNSDEKLINLLLENGVKLDNDSKFFYVADIAIRKQHKEILQKLLEHGGDVNATGANGETLLHSCTIFNFQNYYYNIKHEFTKLILEKGVNVNSQANNGNTPLLDAIKNMSDEVSKVLLEHNADVNIANKKGMTPLHISCDETIKDTVELLLKNNANPNMINKNGKSPLHLATKKLDPDIVKNLLENKADPDIKDKDGQTPLHIVCQNFQPDVLDIIKLLLKHGANIEAVDTKGKTPLIYACTEVKRSPDMFRKKVDYDSMIKYAVRCRMSTRGINFDKWWNDFHSVKLLLANKANIDVVDQEGLTLLHLVAKNNDLEFTENFIKMNIDVNSVDKQGRTPLHLAARYGRAKIVKSLLTLGADVNILTKDSQTALQCAFDGIKHFREHELESLNSSSENMIMFDEDQLKKKLRRNKEIKSYKKTIELLKEYIYQLQSAGVSVEKQNSNLLDQSIEESENDDDDEEDDLSDDSDENL